MTNRLGAALVPGTIYQQQRVGPPIAVFGSQLCGELRDKEAEHLVIRVDLAQGTV